MIGKNVTEIGKGAFAGCGRLTDLIIEGKVVVIGADAFKDCSKLKKISINANSLKAVKSNAFKNVKKGCRVLIFAKYKATYSKAVKMLKKAGLSKAKYSYKMK